MDPSALLAEIRRGIDAEPAARALKRLAEQDPRALDGLGRQVLAAALATDDLRTRWNLVVVLGLLRLAPRERAAATDWLWERLGDASPLTRVFAAQSLVNLAGEDAVALERVRPVLERMLREGTAAERARARILLLRFDAANGPAAPPKRR